MTSSGRFQGNGGAHLMFRSVCGWVLIVCKLSIWPGKKNMTGAWSVQWTGAVVHFCEDAHICFCS